MDFMGYIYKLKLADKKPNSKNEDLVKIFFG